VLIRAAELKEALSFAKDDIVAKSAQIKHDRTWVKKVMKIVEAYVLKVGERSGQDHILSGVNELCELQTRRVNANVRELQADVKKAFHKKRQIENMLIQLKLNQRLK